MFDERKELSSEIELLLKKIEEIGEVPKDWFWHRENVAKIVELEKMLIKDSQNPQYTELLQLLRAHIVHLKDLVTRITKESKSGVSGTDQEREANDINKTILALKIKLQEVEQNVKKNSDGLRETITKVLANYEIGDLVSFEYVEKGAMNLNLKVKTSKGTYFFRGYRIRESKEHIQQEHDLLLYLIKKGFIAVAPLRTKAGTTYIREGEQFFALFDWMKGSPFRFSFSALKRLAHTLASYHLVISDYHPNPEEREAAISKYTMKLNNDLETIGFKIFNAGESIYSQIEKIENNEVSDLLRTNRQRLEQIYRKTATERAQILFTKEDFILVHGDVNYENMLFQRKKMAALLDFGQVKYDPREEELIYVLLGYCTEGVTRPFDLKKLSTFLKAYYSPDQKLRLPPQWIPTLLRFSCFSIVLPFLDLFYYKRRDERPLSPRTEKQELDECGRIILNIIQMILWLDEQEEAIVQVCS